MRRFLVLLSILSIGLVSSALGQNTPLSVEIFPQFAVGPEISTSYTVFNPTEAHIDLKVQLFGTQDIGGGELFDTEVSLGSRETQVLEFTSQEFVTGWAKLSSMAQFNATSFYQIFSGGQLTAQVGVAPGENTRSFRVFGYRDPEMLTNTGIALANPGEEPAEVTAVQLDTDGQEIGKKVFELGPQEHLARNINEPPFFEGTEEYQGTIEFETSSPVVPLTLRQDGLVTTSTPVVQSTTVTSHLSIDSPVFGTGGRTVGGPASCTTTKTGNSCTILTLLTSPDEPLTRQGLDVCFTLKATSANECPAEIRIQRAVTSSPQSRTITLGSEFTGSYCDADVVSVLVDRTGGAPRDCVLSLDWRVDTIGN